MNNLDYYKAYDKRYKQVHDKNLSWSSNNNTKLVEEIITKYNLEKSRILEIGCGEGRDARYLLSKGYNVIATDVSSEAINYCKKVDNTHISNYKILDVLKEKPKEKYNFIYSIACIHMLVLDEDRKQFYKFIYDSLDDNGYSLILTMGDGKKESSSDINKSWDDTERIHEETKEKMNIATTSCRIVSFDSLINEARNNKFSICEYGITEIIPDFPEIMYVLLKKGDHYE
jgi:cyclopropane fatty-acyl-phospholipid synthase-like methyltransferase